jgi:hypothetical protein
MAKRWINLPPMPWSGRAPKQPQDPEKQARSKRLMLLLFANSIALLLLYFGLLYVGFGEIFIIYTVLAALLALGYVIYNRGFVYKDATPQMLPDTLTPDQKQTILDEAAARDQRSRWVLTLLLPMVVSVLLDVLFTFVLIDLFSKWESML